VIEIVSATRDPEELFRSRSPLGLSLKRFAFDKRLEAHIVFENRTGIGEIYNRRIVSKGGNDVLVFVHDDVLLDDHYLADHILQGLERFDVIGVAGNRRRVPNQPAWASIGFFDGKFVADDPANLSGAVAHGESAFGTVWNFGSVPAPCELLDGVLLAARRSKLSAAGVAFDPAFKFHLYDLDFCRTAREKGLRLGTWPVAITHRSAGSAGTAEWKAMYAAYLQKWKS